MSFWRRWNYLLVCIGIILLTFVAVSIFEVLLAIVNQRFYTTITFITLFGVGGVFAAFLSFVQATTQAPLKNETTRWTLIILQIISGLVFFFLLSELEGGEYRLPFKAFGLMLALSSLFFIKGKIDF